MLRIKTIHYPNILDSDYANSLYFHLVENIEWIDGIKTRTGQLTRKACPVEPTQDPILLDVISKVAKKIGYTKLLINGIYLNYYRDGNDYTPTHSHPNRKQLVISLGATRKLKVGNKEYAMNNGDAIVFGSAPHGIPKEPDCKEGRISIALFLLKE